jgi:hypothetical protein
MGEVEEIEAPAPSTRISARLSRPIVTSRPTGKLYLLGPSQTITGAAAAPVGIASPSAPFRAHLCWVGRRMSNRHHAPTNAAGASVQAVRARYQVLPGCARSRSRRGILEDAAQ